MGPLIAIVSIALFVVLFVFTINRLGEYETKQKIIIYIAGTVVSLIITMLIFGIVSLTIDYNNPETKQAITRMLMPIFIPINGIIYMPYFSKIINSVKAKEISKDDAQRKLIKSIIVIAIIYIIEIIYLRNVQTGILEMEKLYINK